MGLSTSRGHGVMEGNEESAAFEGDNAAVAACDEEASRESSCAQFEQDELAALRQVTKNGAPPPLSLSSCEVSFSRGSWLEVFVWSTAGDR